MCAWGGPWEALGAVRVLGPEVEADRERGFSEATETHTASCVRTVLPYRPEDPEHQFSWRTLGAHMSLKVCGGSTGRSAAGGLTAVYFLPVVCACRAQPTPLGLMPVGGQS